MWIFIYSIISLGSYHIATGTAEFTSYANCRAAVEQIMQQTKVYPATAVCVKK